MLNRVLEHGRLARGQRALSPGGWRYDGQLDQALAQPAHLLVVHSLPGLPMPSRINQPMWQAAIVPSPAGRFTSG
jgi:hypothetical protein